MAQPGTTSRATRLLSSAPTVAAVHIHTRRCSICNEILERPRPDGQIEKAVILPCSHIFGSICIQRWLEVESQNHDCPNCRRRMVYSGCGHAIKPCDLSKAPKCLREEDMPEKCLVCRGDGKLEEELRVRNERLLMEERALEGLRMHLPSVFGGMCKNTVESVDSRIEDLRREWMADLDAIYSKFEEKEGRNHW